MRLPPILAPIVVAPIAVVAVLTVFLPAIVPHRYGWRTVPEYSGSPARFFVSYAPGTLPNDYGVEFTVPDPGYEAEFDGIEGVGSFTIIRVNVTSPPDELLSTPEELVVRVYVDGQVLRETRVDHPDLAVEVRQVQRGVEYESPPPFQRALVLLSHS